MHSSQDASEECCGQGEAAGAGNDFVGAQEDHFPLCIVPPAVAATTTLEGATSDTGICCEENTCTAPTSADAGYTIKTLAGTTVSGLGALGCDASVNTPDMATHPTLAAQITCNAGKKIEP